MKDGDVSGRRSHSRRQLGVAASFVVSGMVHELILRKTGESRPPSTEKSKQSREFLETYIWQIASFSVTRLGSTCPPQAAQW